MRSVNWEKISVYIALMLAFLTIIMHVTEMKERIAKLEAKYELSERISKIEGYLERG